MSRTRYDDIGGSYSHHRRPDPAIAAQLGRALDGARRVLNVGAGTGSYEPAGVDVLAVEPSPTMIAQRPPGSAPAVRARAEELPFKDRSFDAAMAILTLHHWTDPARGLSEMRRVAGRTLVLTFDPALEHDFWLVREYLPEIAELDYGLVPSPERVGEALGTARIEVVPVPHDCVDGFLCAYWRRPAAYLDPDVRAGISGLARLDPGVVRRGTARLASDLESGRWLRRHGDLLGRAAMDWGYRLVVAGGAREAASGVAAGRLPP